MFNNDVTQTYDHLDASAEILIMLTGAFFLGCLLCWLLRQFLLNSSTSRVNEGYFDATLPHITGGIHAKKNKESIGKNMSNNTKSRDSNKASDFTIINGITPKIDSLLRDKNINSYSDLRDINNKSLNEIFNSSITNKSTKQTVKTWSHQAALAAKGDWRKLSEYQDFIDQAILSEKDSKNNINPQHDQLQKIKGIGPQIEKILNSKGISTFTQLKKADADILKEHISKADSRFENNQTATWPHQANMAEKGQWKELAVYQEFMDDINIDSENLAATIKKNSSTTEPQTVTKTNIRPHNVSPIIVDKKQTFLNYKFTNINSPVFQSVDKNISSSNKTMPSSSVEDPEKDKPNDLKKLEGIDSDVEKLLNNHKIYTFNQLHNSERSTINAILENAGNKFKGYEPKSWSHQAGMAARGEWDDLKTYQGYVNKKHKSSFISKSSNSNKKDDLKIVEGIGPKIEGVLNQANILTFQDLKQCKRNYLKSLLDEAGPQYRMHEPETWPLQAGIADDEDWEKLKEYQQFLTGGRE